MALARQLTSSASLKGKGSRGSDSWQSEAPRRASDASVESKKLSKINNVRCERREKAAVTWRSFVRLSCAAFGMGLAGASAQTENVATDKSQYTILNPTPIDLRRAFNTDRPSITDSPFTIDAGVFQIESDVANWRVNTENHVRTRTWIIGNTNFRIGLTNWMDLQIFPQLYANRRTSGKGFGSALVQDGFGDTTLRLKINLLGDEGGKLVVGLVSSLKIPTNTGHTGNHVWEPGFGLPVNYSLPWGFTLFAQTRIDILDKTRSSSLRVQWQNPIGLSRTIVGNLSGYVEFYDAVSPGPWIGTLDTGLIYQATPNFSIDVDSFFGLTRSADDLNIFVGFARRF
jgi:Putative MetA-pathway of phenol degradation